MKIKDLYVNWIANVISGGTLIKREKMDSFSIRPAYNKILTKKHASKVWMVTEIPIDYSSNLTHVVRKATRDSFSEVSAVVHMHSSPVYVPVASKLFQNKMNHSIQYYEDYRESLEGLSDVRGRVGKVFKNGMRAIRLSRKGLEQAENEMNSHIYINQSVTESIGMFDTYYFIVAKCDDIDRLNKFSDYFTDYLTNRGIEVNLISGDLNNYMQNFGPTTIRDIKLKKFYPILTSSENLAALSPTMTRGLFGNGRGVLFGRDMESDLPVKVDMFNSSSAQVYLVIGMAGHGKTMATQMILLSVLSKGVHASVIDMKGDEWDRLFPLIDKNSYLKFDMDEGYWVNTMKISGIEMTSEEGLMAYNLAVETTVKVIMIGTAIDEGNKDAYDFIKEGVAKAYNKVPGFNKAKPDTYYLADNLTYMDVINSIDGLRDNSLSPAQNELLSSIVRRSASEFKEDQMPKSKEIALSDVLTRKYIVYAFNLAKGRVFTPHRDGIRLLMVSLLKKRKHHYRKRSGGHTLEIAEEVQDAGSEGKLSLVNIIGEDVTIGRSENVSVMLITNTTRAIFSESMSSVRSNITGLMVGKLIKEDIEKISSLNGGSEIIENVRKINNDTGGKLDKCFALRMDNGSFSDTTIVKALVPPEIEQRLRQRSRLND